MLTKVLNNNYKARTHGEINKFKPQVMHRYSWSYNNLQHLEWFCFCFQSITLHLSSDCVQCAGCFHWTFLHFLLLNAWPCALVHSRTDFMQSFVSWPLGRFLRTSTSDCSLLIFCWNWDSGSQFERSFQKGPCCRFLGPTDGPVQGQQKNAAPLKVCW